MITFSPEAIYIEEGAENYALSKSVLERFPQVPITKNACRKTILNQITAEKVRNLSNWAKKEMADYEFPAFKNQTFRATHIQNNENLLIESVLDTLPSHHPLVTRQLKLYLIYNRKHNTIIDAIVTIRGWAEE